MKVGFIGLGRMGLPMAERLTASDYPLAVWNRTPSRAAPLTAAGAVLAHSPQELATDCDIIITMLSDAQAVSTVLCGPDGALTVARAGAIFIDMSTIGPNAARRIAAEAAPHGVKFLDAPVSGSITLAGQGMLTTMVGGPRSAFEQAKPVLAVLSKAQHYLGVQGAGAAMKLAVNIVIAATNQAVAEALALAEGSGIDRAAAYDVLDESAISSPFIGYKRQAFLDPGTVPVSFTTALMSKDLELAIGVAGASPLPVTTAAKEFLDASCAAGFADADFSSVAELIRHHDHKDRRDTRS